MSNTDLVTIEESRFLPALTTNMAMQRYNSLLEFVQTAMRPDTDYGIIPGTTKPTLLKPGAEKLTTLFGLSVRFQLVTHTEDWDATEPFFYYLYRCQLWRGDLLIAESDGSCNSRETKYRWRESKRACPACGQTAIIKGKAEYGGGWLCFKKQGGCGAKYQDGDGAIEGQPIGRVVNPEICDQVNTFQKMAQKRAMIAAVLIGVNASEFFTQDMEDLPPIGNGSSYAPPQVDTKTGEIIDQPPPPPNGKRARTRQEIHDAVLELRDQATRLGKEIKHKNLGEATIAELIEIGKAYRAALGARGKSEEADLPL